MVSMKTAGLIAAISCLMLLVAYVFGGVTKPPTVVKKKNGVVVTTYHTKISRIYIEKYVISFTPGQITLEERIGGTAGGIPLYRILMEAKANKITRFFFWGVANAAILSMIFALMNIAAHIRVRWIHYKQSS